MLRKVRVTSLRFLREFTLSELAEELRKPGAGGAKFSFSPPARRAFIKLGVQDLPKEPPKEPPKKVAFPKKPAARTVEEGEEEEDLDVPEFIIRGLAAAGGADAADAADGDDEEARDPTPPTRPKGDIWREAVADAQHARALFGVKHGQPSAAQLKSAIAHAAAIVELPPPALGADADATEKEVLEEAVDHLDMLLAKADARGLKAFSLDSLRAVPKQNARSAVKWLATLPLDAADMATHAGKDSQVAKGSKGEQGTTGSGFAMASAVLDATSQRKSQADLKLVAELNAAEKRLKTVFKSETETSALSEYAKLAQGEAANDEKVSVYASMAEDAPDLYKLMLTKSEYVRDPQGASALLPGLVESVANARAGREGLMRAVKKQLAHALPPNAEPAVLGGGGHLRRDGPQGRPPILASGARFAEGQGLLVWRAGRGQAGDTLGGAARDGCTRLAHHGHASDYRGAPHAASA